MNKNELISRKQAKERIDSIFPVDRDSEYTKGIAVGLAMAKVAIDDMEPEKYQGSNNHDIAEMLSDLFGDTCACNFFGIDDWLPCYCELENDCPYPQGVACWEQFLKYWDKHKGK